MDQLVKKKGKCFSKVNQGKRIAQDMYETPYSMTRQLLDIMHLDKKYSVLEPGCGNGAIVKVLQEYGCVNISAYDKYTDFAVGETHPASKNFFEEEREFDIIITNPPYREATKFIQCALPLARIGILFLLPLGYLHGKERFDLFYSKRVLGSVHIFTRMPMLGDELREDGKYNTGMQPYGWFFFSVRHVKSSPDIHWIDNSKYILRKEDGNNKRFDKKSN